MLTHKIIIMADHKEWGNAINWLSYNKRRLEGCMTPKPVVGDQVECVMTGGGTARFTIIETDYPGDPRDAFFATTDNGHYV